jgi:AAA domain
MWAWGVSAALKESDDELAQRRERAQAGTAADPLTRPSAQDFWTDEGELPRPPGVAPADDESDGGPYYTDGYVTDSSGETLYVGTQEREATPEELAAHQYQLELAAKVRSMRMAAEAKEILAAETRGEFETLDWDAFLDSKMPEYLVPQMLPRDGTSKVFGPPGGTKSFFVLDLALSMATGTPWRGLVLPRTRVHYVMAEGRSTNVARTVAWLHQRGVPREAARGWFTAIPQGVLLTEHGVARYVERVVAEQPGWVILDTKNRMMVGSENDAGDVGVMVRAMDLIRQSAGVDCNVTLIDHTGLSDDTRGRGSNAVQAAMDTEIRVTVDSGIACAEITRDKNAEPGYRVTYRLQVVPELARGTQKPPAVVVACDAQEAVTFGHPDDWQKDHPSLPSDILEYRGDGYGAVKELARFMRARARGDIGVSRLEARQAVMERYPAVKKDTIYRAWSALVELVRLKPEKASDPIGRAHWVSFDDDPAMP